MKPWLIPFIGLIIAGCTPHNIQSTSNSKMDDRPTSTHSNERSGYSPAPVEKYSEHQYIKDCVKQATQDKFLDDALACLDTLTSALSFPDNVDADFRRIQLMVEWNRITDISEAENLLTVFPDHALAPDLNLTLSNWYLQHGNVSQALTALESILKHPKSTEMIKVKALDNGVEMIAQASNLSAVRWLLVVAQQQPEFRDDWLGLAAQTSTMETLEQLANSGDLNEQMAPFILMMARQHLILNQMEEVAQINAWVEQYLPSTQINRTLKSWLNQKNDTVIEVGVLLPLSGAYSQYGQEALRGIRMAISKQLIAGNIHLHIEDSGDGSASCIAAYQRLIGKRVDWVVGPLLSQHVEALIPYLNPHIPMLALSSDSRLATQHPALFIHNLSHTIQAQFMAEQAWDRGARKIVIIQESDASFEKESSAFANTFIKLGGEISMQLRLAHQVDNRLELQTLRRETDDALLLSELSEDLFLLSPEINMTIQVPVNFDAIYIVAYGKKVAALAGQLAYLEITNTPIYGSDRWQDHHLQNDKGRYLGNARFIDIPFPNGDDEKTLQVRHDYKSVWGEKYPLGKLFATAYDTMNIVTFLATRQHVTKERAIRALMSSEGFPAITGHLSFDRDGVGHKRFNIYRLKNGQPQQVH
ncbi:MAG: penicillin-binding protein activator [Zetaproteobacteria bacterium]|nr:penicillin-binding protein activator [Zetaproteobacteria bacterium]